MIVGKNILFILLVIIICLIIIIWYEETTKKKLPEQIPLIGIIGLFSFLWILFTINLSINETKPLDLNNWGDFLAGFFAPVLFFWVVFGIFLQKKEFKKVTDTFELQQEEFSKSVTAMNNQVIQVEIQHLNTWFNRNINTINKIKETMIKNIAVENIDSLALIKKSLFENYTLEEEYFNIFDEIKNILDIFIYIEEYLEKLESEKEDIIYINSLREIKKEFLMLYENEIKDTKEIMKVVYFLIAASSKNIKYKIYRHWLVDDADINNIYLIGRKENFEDTIKYIIDNIHKIELNFKTGKINGNI